MEGQEEDDVEEEEEEEEEENVCITTGNEWKRGDLERSRQKGGDGRKKNITDEKKGKEKRNK